MNNVVCCDGLKYGLLRFEGLWKIEWITFSTDCSVITSDAAIAPSLFAVRHLHPGRNGTIGANARITRRVRTLLQWASRSADFQPATVAQAAV